MIIYIWKNVDSWGKENCLSQKLILFPICKYKFDYEKIIV